MDAISCLPPPAALHFSLSSADSSAPPPAAAYYAPPHVTTTCCDSVLVADSPMAPGGGRRHKQLAPAGGRAGKRRSRAPKRAPTTYVTTDPANFRAMVQQITGVQADDDIDVLLHPTTAIDAVLMAADATVVGAHGAGNPLHLPVPDADEVVHQQPCFPTLDSWNVMYETSELL